ncbi:hypothetical protein [Wenyingzhuangia sp. 2_MG-2023]|uniref:hypothetical protein n=1 Tax=Wenyingzhuangia sp. 2_MG-2023 TaxID=3062639 RepID=UPI0026E3E342|nr:hypothetical protein [Wenyingzhuangia sp. 2_MG-2023]MDO6737085.1 hypothetical protein [Wenyingzhuangia sp. 2_MG-2023]
MSRIPIKYEILKVNLAKKVAAPFMISVKYRKEDSVEWTVANPLVECNEVGYLQTKVVLTDLEEATEYRVRLTTLSNNVEYDDVFKTNSNITVGESPYYLKKLFKEQHFTWYITGVDNEVEPSGERAGFYYRMLDKFREYREWWGSMDSSGKSWTSRTSTNNTDVVSKCFLCDSLYLWLNQTHENEEARIDSRLLFTTQPNASSGDTDPYEGVYFAMNFFVDTVHTSVVLFHIFGNTGTKQFKITYSSGSITVADGLDTTTLSTNFPVENWYTMRLHLNSSDLDIFIYEAGDLKHHEKIAYDIKSWAAPVSDTSVKFPIYIGDKQGGTTGLAIQRVFMGVDLPLDVYNVSNATEVRLKHGADGRSENVLNAYANFSKIAKFYDFQPTFIFNKTTSSNPSDKILGIGAKVLLGQGSSVGTETFDTNKAPVMAVTITYDTTTTATLAELEDYYEMTVHAYFYVGPTSTNYTAYRTVTNKIYNSSLGNTDRQWFAFENADNWSVRLEVSIDLIKGTTKVPVGVDITSITLDQLNSSYELQTTVTKTVDQILRLGSGQPLLVRDNIDGALVSELLSDSHLLSIPTLATGTLTDEEYFADSKWLGFVRSDSMNMIIDPLIPSGNYSMSIGSTGSDDIDGFRLGGIPIEVISSNEWLQDEAFLIDFENAVDFEAEKDKFFELFDTNHTQWGGYNGGCSGELIYFNETDKSIVLENHGDNYPQDGEIIGVAKPPKNYEFKGYGQPSFYEGADDPNYLSPFRTRVGSILITKKYCEYGKMTVRMKLPVGIYGVCPALWFFHYMELYPTDPRWDTWIAKGGQPYGGADPYMVINNEIDMELPSQVTMGAFATWTEQSTAYFDLDALDNQYHIGITDDPTTENNGTFLLKDTDNARANPNARESWTRVSKYVQGREQPTYDNCKFNNWVGEKSSGNGWAYNENDYDGEEYIAKLTKLSYKYNDNKYHDWGLAWYPDRTELWVDGELIRTTTVFVPFNIMKYTLGGWFPSYNLAKIQEWIELEYRNLYEEGTGSWAGTTAKWEVCNFQINRILWEPFTTVDKSNLEYNAEGYPEAGIRELKKQ